jgi:hypothetical protein
MNARLALLLFAGAGVVAANGGAWLALQRMASPGRGLAVFLAGYAAWLGLGLWLDPRMLAAVHPWHALATSLALFVVLAYPGFVAARWARQ